MNTGNTVNTGKFACNQPKVSLLTGYASPAPPALAGVAPYRFAIKKMAVFVAFMMNQTIVMYCVMISYFQDQYNYV